MKRLLCLISNMNAGGAETFLMKLYRQLDKTKYQMDFCVNNTQTNFHEAEILAMGGRMFRIPPKSMDAKAFRQQLDRLIREEQYESVLRITSNAAGFMDLQIAKKAGAKRCIARSSNSQDVGGWKSKVIHRVGRFLYGKYVDVKLAPSDLAAIYTFGKKAYKNGKVHILHNAVDLNVFRYDAAGREEIRKEFGIEDDCLLVGHVGRFMTQKNHRYLLKVFARIQKINPKAKLLLVGNGELEEMLHQQVKQMGLEEYVIFAGVRSDVPKLLSAMDVFVFPSLYEGMPNTVIEAQATGLPCVISDTITREADVTGIVQYLSLRQSVEGWAAAACEVATAERKNTHGDFIAKRYDIETIAKDFVELVFEGK